jgi:hypothetical protein
MERSANRPLRIRARSSMIKGVVWDPTADVIDVIIWGSALK